MPGLNSKSDEELLNRFVKHVHKASIKAAERERIRRDLQRKVDQIKRLIGRKSVKKETVASAFQDLHDKLNDIIKRENRILLRQEKEDTNAENIKKQLEIMKESISAISRYDIESVESLKDQIKEFEAEMTSIKSKITDISGQREAKIEELEEKIKKKLGKNYNELLKIEEMIRSMEARYELARRKGAPEEYLEPIRERIGAMKEKVGEEKTRLEEAPGIPKGIPMIEPSREKPKPVMKKKPLIKHEIMFGEIPKAKPSVPAEDRFPPPLHVPRMPKLGLGFEAMPPPPLPPPSIEMPEEIPPRRKKGFLSRLIGK
jgi:DNA polymerase III alpha subunit (gram-positive type)